MSVFGVYGLGEAASNIYYGLHALQHRGQEGAGIVTFDADGGAHRKRGLGLVSEVFNAENLSALKGNIGVGSVQYANIAKGGGDNVQPLFFHHRSGDFAVAGDGSVINSAGITDYLEARGCLFQTSTDSELLAQLIKKDVNKPRIFQICNALNMMEGGFAFLIATRNPGTPAVTGFSMGANHAVITFLRRPDLFRGVIALSGVYDTDYFFDGWMNPTLYESAPDRFLPGMRADHPYVALYNERKMILCVGQGAWEEDGVRSLKYLESVFRDKGIHAWCDFWGGDVNHDWPWWFKQMRYFIPKMIEE